MDTATVLAAVAVVMSTATAVMIYTIPQIITLKKEWSDFKQSTLKELKESIARLDERTEIMLKYMQFIKLCEGCEGEMADKRARRDSCIHTSCSGDSSLNDGNEGSRHNNAQPRHGIPFRQECS